MSETADTEHVRAGRVFDPIDDAFGRAAGPDDQAPDPLLELQQAEQGIEPEPEPVGEPEVEYEVVDDHEGDEGEWFEPEAEYTPEQIAEFQQAFQERWEELADEDPQGAAEALAQLYAGEAQAEIEEQVRAEWAERLGPMQEQHSHDHAAAIVGQLQEDFGPEIFELHKEHMAAVVQADPERFRDMATRGDRLREVLMAAEYARAAGFDWDAYATEQIAPPVPARDAFGKGEQKRVQITREQYNAEIEKARRGQKSILRPRPAGPGVHGDGSAPPPMGPLKPHVDPEIAAMDAAAAPRGRDNFGRYG